ncbi:DZIP3 [Symbiodinium necroappetens]|uniref:DZIP3 protein n=1 Tax=Symbiodinium necroappetens TaxID=1628268 RepID=A0A812ZZ32_9DINO|nr:DZIP3 [Symbiodinium necroappetens]
MACNMQRKLQVVIVVSVFVACAAGMAMTHLSMSPSEYKRNWLIFVGVPLLCILLVGTSIIIMFMETSSNNNHVVRVKSQETPEARCVWAPSRYDMLQSMSPQFCCVHIGSGRREMSKSIPALQSSLSASCARDSISATCLCCLEDFRPESEVALLPCGHVFHEECITSWSMSPSKSARSCPACRMHYDEESVPV